MILRTFGRRIPSRCPTLCTTSTRSPSNRPKGSAYCFTFTSSFPSAVRSSSQGNHHTQGYYNTGNGTSCSFAGKAGAGPRSIPPREPTEYKFVKKDLTEAGGQTELVRHLFLFFFELVVPITTDARLTILDLFCVLLCGYSDVSGGKIKNQMVNLLPIYIYRTE